MYGVQGQGDPKSGKKFAQFLKSSQNSFQAQKCQNIYIKALFESPNYLHETTFETLKYVQQTMLRNFLFRQTCKKFA